MTSGAQDPAVTTSEGAGASRAWAVAAALGFLGVALGAFGAHALKSALRDATEGDLRLAWWDTATRYHLWHALLCGLLALRTHHPRARTGVGLVVVGVVLFSGSLYAMALTNVRALGAITPLGGVAFLGAWLCLGLTARTHQP
jgi:uncharacterized membrane protein YgdD (TMEM256/DUF423 family)